MTLGDFLKQFSHNNLIRLHYQIKGGCELILETWDDVSMDHEILKGKGKNRHYIGNNVLSLASIYVRHSHYPEAINIVIEKLDSQPQIKEFCEHPGIRHGSVIFIESEPQ